MNKHIAAFLSIGLLCFAVKAQEAAIVTPDGLQQPQSVVLTNSESSSSPRYEQDEEGNNLVVTNSYTQLATGLNRYDETLGWVPAPAKSALLMGRPWRLENPTPGHLGRRYS